MGEIFSYPEGKLTSYLLEVDDPSKLDQVKEAGFKDAFIVE